MGHCPLVQEGGSEALCSLSAKASDPHGAQPGALDRRGPPRAQTPARVSIPRALSQMVARRPLPPWDSPTPPPRYSPVCCPDPGVCRCQTPHGRHPHSDQEDPEQQSPLPLVPPATRLGQGLTQGVRPEVELQLIQGEERLHVPFTFGQITI